MLGRSQETSQSKRPSVGVQGLSVVSRSFCHQRQLLLRAFTKAQDLSHTNISLLWVPFRLYWNVSRNNEQPSRVVPSCPWLTYLLIFISLQLKPSPGSSLQPGGRHVSQVQKKRSNSSTSSEVIWQTKLRLRTPGAAKHGLLILLRNTQKNLNFQTKCRKKKLGLETYGVSKVMCNLIFGHFV